MWLWLIIIVYKINVYITHDPKYYAAVIDIFASLDNWDFSQNKNSIVHTQTMLTI